jgi:uncharacterized cupin superfamily protein
MNTWEPCPLEDTARVVSGHPYAEISHIAADGSVSAGYWRCTPGGFIWSYDEDETIVIMDGVANINGTTYSAGHSLRFARGSKARWDILETITKMYVIQKPVPIARRIVRKLASWGMK